MSVIGSHMLAGSSGTVGAYQVERSLRFNSADSAYLNRTPASAGNRKTWTWSGWVKRSALPTSGYSSIFGADSGSGSSFYFSYENSTHQLEFGQGATVYRKSSQVFRDPSAHFHILVTLDTTQSTATNRIKLYVNGVQVTAFATSNDPTLNADLALNNNVSHSIGADIPSTGARNYFSGYLTEIHFIDGQALDPTSFAETDATTGQWIPKAYTGTYGTNGFYLKFADNSGVTATTLGKDSSGNGNNWTPNNFSVTAGSGNDSLVDSPTNYGTDTGAGGEVRGNYCTINPLAKLATSPTISNGNLYASGTDTGVIGTIAVTSGKWYAECTYDAVKAGDNTVGVQSLHIFSSNSAPSPLRVIGAVGYDSAGGTASKAVDNTFSSYGALLLCGLS